MNVWRYQPNRLAILSLVALGIVAASLWYSNRLVQQMAAKEERLVRFWADALELINDPETSPQETQFLLNQVILNTRENQQLVYVPAILTDSTGQHPRMHNLQFPKGLSEADSLERLLDELAYMKHEAGYAPIRVNLPTGGYQLVYFRETDTLQRLRYFPYVTLLVLGLFVSIVFVNYYIAQRSQLNKVWAGLAKETAHQLGTPISALLAWVELLRLEVREDQQEVVQELEKDIHHLDRIAKRFSKVGSEPELERHDLRETLRKSMDYYRKRSSTKVNFELNDRLGEDPGQADITPMLFEWVIENLLKNALDAGATRIELSLFRKKQEYLIDVDDNGKGIAKRSQKNIFKPGVTSKKRGWGLGLSLARRIIRSFHHGRILLRWSEPGKGSSFRVAVPVPREK